MDLFGDVETVEENGGVGFSGVAVLVADDAFELAETHAVFVGHFGFLVDAVALFKGGPEWLVAHDDGVDDAVGVEGELILTEDAELHECRFAGAVGPGEAVATAGDEADGDFFEENFSAVAHGDVADTEHGGEGSYVWAAVWFSAAAAV